MALSAATVTSLAHAQAPVPIRTPLAQIPVAPFKTVSRVETNRVVFLPGQAMPKHKHSVPVICFIYQGDVLVILSAAEPNSGVMDIST